MYLPNLANLSALQNMGGAGDPRAVGPARPVDPRFGPQPQPYPVNPIQPQQGGQPPAPQPIGPYPVSPIAPNPVMPGPVTPSPVGPAPPVGDPRMMGAQNGGPPSFDPQVLQNLLRLRQMMQQQPAQATY